MQGYGTALVTPDGVFREGSKSLQRSTKWLVPLMREEVGQTRAPPVITDRLMAVTWVGPSGSHHPPIVLIERA